MFCLISNVNIDPSETINFFWWPSYKFNTNTKVVCEVLLHDVKTRKWGSRPDLSLHYQFDNPHYILKIFGRPFDFFCFTLGPDLTVLVSRSTVLITFHYFQKVVGANLVIVDGVDGSFEIQMTTVRTLGRRRH